MKLSVIIPNYNGYRFLPDCLSSLKQQTFSDFEIILIDNGSTDESLLFIRREYPDIRIIALPHNAGFSAAVNKGILASDSPYVLLLNNDTVLAPACLETLVSAIEKDTSAFSVGARILSLQPPCLTDTDGDYYSLMGYAFCRRQGLPAKKHRQKTYPVFTNCACSCIYRKSLFEKTGLFDEHFFAYLEDVDLGFRARRLGLSNILCPDAIVYHVGSGTTAARYTPFKVFHSARNNLLLAHKNLTLLQKILHAPFSIAGMILKYLFFRRYHLEKAYLKGCISGVRACARLPVPKTSFFTSAVSLIRTEPWIFFGTALYIRQYLQRRLKG